MNENESILIIDDEVQIRRLLEISLTSNGYKTIFASSGKEGLISAAANHPSVIILDLGLPDIDGIDLLKKLRWNPFHVKTRLLIIAQPLRVFFVFPSFGLVRGRLSC